MQKKLSLELFSTVRLGDRVTINTEFGRVSGIARIVERRDAQIILAKIGDDAPVVATPENLVSVKKGPRTKPQQIRNALR